MNPENKIIIKIGPSEIKSNRDYVWFSFKLFMWLALGILCQHYIVSFFILVYLKHLDYSYLLDARVFYSLKRTYYLYWPVYLFFSLFLYRFRRIQTIAFVVINPSKNEYYLYEDNHQETKYPINSLKIKKNLILIDGIQNYFVNSFIIRNLKEKITKEEIVILEEIFKSNQSSR